VTEPLHVWRQLDVGRGATLVDARLQLHHAAQLAAAFGISYLPAQPDDSHTNLQWIESLDVLASKPAASPAIRIAVRATPLTVLVLDAKASALGTYLLDGRTVSDAATWVRAQLTAHGLDATRYTLARHYEIPKHRFGDGAAFESSRPTSFQELASWYSNAAAALEEFVSTASNASPARCWPHHFDIATLIQVAPGQTISLGMAPGDAYYAEPYFYASMYPPPSVNAPRSDLAGNGQWHTHEWIGAVLPAARVSSTNQRAQIGEFIRSAVDVGKRLLLGS
jgi:hypothetical protein